MNLRSWFRLFGFLFLVAGSGLAQTVGALGNGTSSRATSLGGATVATITSPLEAMQSNPAGLAELHAISRGEAWLRLNSGELFRLHQQGLTRIS